MVYSQCGNLNESEGLNKIVISCINYSESNSNRGSSMLPSNDASL